MPTKVDFTGARDVQAVLRGTAWVCQSILEPRAELLHTVQNPAKDCEWYKMAAL